MSGDHPDLAGVRRSLLNPEHRGDLAFWTTALLESAIETAGVAAEIRAAEMEDRWPVEVAVNGHAAVLVDWDEVIDRASLGRLELRAALTWRGVTRHAASFETRPWVGAVRVLDSEPADSRGVERLTQLVASRELDAACVVMVGSTESEIRSPSPLLSVESFMSSLIGRFLVLSSLQTAS